MSDAEALKSINVDKEAQYADYKEKLILYDKNEVKSIDCNGNTVFSLNMKMKNCKMDSNYYIDILDKEKNKVYSIDAKGNFVFKENVPPETIIYKSINEHTFFTTYKKNNKEYIKIQDEQKNVNTELEYKNKITGVYNLDGKILVSDIETRKNISSNLVIYDENGNQKNKLAFDNAMIDICVGKEYLYVVFLDNIVVLDFNLDKKSDIKIKEINKISKTDNDYLYIIDKEKNLSYVEKLSYKKGKNTEKADEIESINGSYIRYLKNSVYNKNGDKIMEYKQNIKDSIKIDNKTIAIIFNNYLEIVKIC